MISVLDSDLNPRHFTTLNSHSVVPLSHKWVPEDLITCKPSCTKKGTFWEEMLIEYLKKLLDKLFKRCVTNYIYLIDRQGEHLRYF